MHFNEIRVDQAGADDDEFIELAATPNSVLDVELIVIGDGAGGSGTIDDIEFISAIVPASGLVVIAESTFSGVADVTTTLNLENSDNLTFLLVDLSKLSVGTDLDTNDDGTLDVVTWGQTFDIVALVEDDNPPPDADDEWHYGPGATCLPGPTCGQAGPNGTAEPPFHIQRCADDTGAWTYTNDELSADTPGAPNACACQDAVLVTPLEECDDGAESATCDDDCTAASCGDGTLNTTAGEQCDDGGESPLCDVDCTPAVCGDGTVNNMAGETCDDMGRSGACDDNCTAASCGDGTLNTTAGEQCDDGGESATCDTDCTMAVCGDMVVNATAGEQCDDMGESATCDDDCTDATCGDGTVNATAGETCDDRGESLTCNADCTAASCGDGTVNATAGETCDDMGESETCDADCTPAECGDGVVNAAAGEECDEDSADCVDCGFIKGGTTGGDTTGGGETGVDDTAGPGGETTTGDIPDPTDPGGTTLPPDGDSGSGDDTGTTPANEDTIDGCGSCRGGTGGGLPAALLGFVLVGLRRRRR